MVQPITKQYGVSAPPGGANVRPGPSRPNRTYYYVQNTGPNTGVFRWDDKTGVEAGADIELIPGDWREWAIWCPTQAANFGSTLGTTFAVIEGSQG